MSVPFPSLEDGEIFVPESLDLATLSPKRAVTLRDIAAVSSDRVPPSPSMAERGKSVAQSRLVFSNFPEQMAPKEARSTALNRDPPSSPALLVLSSKDCPLYSAVLQNDAQPPAAQLVQSHPPSPSKILQSIAPSFDGPKCDSQLLPASQRKLQGCLNPPLLGQVLRQQRQIRGKGSNQALQHRLHFPDHIEQLEVKAWQVVKPKY